MNFSYNSLRSRAVHACATALVGLALAPAAQAQAWPSRPITWLYPFGESAATAWVRTIASEMSKSLGQPVLVENRPGAGGRVGMTQLMNGKPDGYLISIAIPLSVPSSRWPLLSLPRFGLVVFPLFLALAVIGRRPRVHTAIVTVGALLLGVVTVQWALWQWVA